MLNNVLKKVQNTLNEGIKNVKMIVNTLNETRPTITIHEKNYYLDNLIAEGGYALIYKIQSVSDDKFLALKKINIQSSNHKKQIKREIKIWKELSKFNNIVELVDFEITEKHVYIVMELCEEGTLLDFVNNHEGNISEVEALLIFNQILLGVNAMHCQKPPIAHRDLKIENILKKKRNYKICDFGSATDEIFDPTTSDEFVKEENFSNFEKHSTLYYRAPEMCDRYGEYQVTEKVDIWSLGCVLYTMVFKEQPFMNAQKLEIINGNYNFPKDEQKLYSEKFLDLIRVMLTPNPNNRPSVIQIMEWTNYWNETQKIPLSPEVEEIKNKQIKSGGITNKSHKKKLLTAEEIQKIQSKIKSKEKKKKNYDDINELFGFAKKNDEEEDQKEEEPKKSNLNDDLFAVFSGAPQNKINNNDEKKSNNQNNDDLLEMQFYEVDETKQENNAKNKKNENTNLNNDLDAIFGNPSSNNNNNKNNNKKEENKNFDLLFSNENVKETKKEDNNNIKKTDLNDLLNAINNESKNDNTNNKDSNNNAGAKNITYVMNGQDLFSNFPSSEPSKKKEEDDLFAAFNNPQAKSKEKNNEKPSKLEDDLFAAFNQPKEKPVEKKEKEETNKAKIEDDLFGAFNQPQPKKEEEKKIEKKPQKLEDDLFAAFNPSQEKPKKEENKKNLEDDLFAAFSQPQKEPKVEAKNKENKKQKVEDDLFSAFNQPKTNQKEEENKKTKVEDDLFAAFNQPKTNQKEETKKAKVEDDLFAAFSQPQIKPKEGGAKKEENNNDDKKAIKNNIEFDLFNFGNTTSKSTTNTENKNKSKDNNFDLLFNLNNNTNKENGGDNIENGQTQPKNNQENKNGESDTQNKGQDIFGFFQ